MKKNILYILLLLCSMTTFGQVLDCTPACPNYPCCLEREECDDTPCDKDPWGIDPYDDGVTPKDRVVIWIHGMEGSRNSWNRYYNKFHKEFKIGISVADYATSKGAVNGANEVEIENLQPLMKHRHVRDNAKNFIVAHSMGGIISRQLDLRNSTDAFGGFVTFGTPHQGTQIANNARDGTLSRWILEGTSALARGPLVSSHTPLVGNFSTNLLTNIVKNKLIDPFAEHWAAPSATSSLSVGSSLLGQHQDTGKPKIAFSGAEDSPTLWREVSSFVSFPSLNITFSPSELPLDRESDDVVPEAVESLRAKYFNNFELHNSMIVPGAIGLNTNVQRAEAWLDGFIWLTQANSRWQGFMGAATNPVTVSIPVFKLKKLALCITQVVPETKSFVIFSNKPNDGVVLAESGIELTNAALKEILPGVNHQQCMNHKNVTRALTKSVFGGEGDRFFLTARR